jgi:hypothetical protein
MTCKICAELFGHGHEVAMFGGVVKMGVGGGETVFTDVMLAVFGTY